MSTRKTDHPGLFGTAEHAPRSTGERAILQGTVARIIYSSPEGRYTVVRLQVEGLEEATVVGEIFPISEGEEIRVAGSWKVHPRYGFQLRADQWEKLEPATREGIEKYLGSGLIKGIGPVLAKRLVSAFGLETLKVLTEKPDRILEVEGIGRERARRILKAWTEHRGLHEVMVFLQGHGISSSLALKIHRTLGAQTVARVKANPYCLAEEVHGVGFLTSDRIAEKLGIKHDSPLRIQAGILHILEKSSQEGHCFVPRSMIRKSGFYLLGARESAIDEGIEVLRTQNKIVLEESPGEANRDWRVYPKPLYQAECLVAAALRSHLACPSVFQSNSGIPRGSDAEIQSDLLLEKEQREAVLEALKNKVIIITGGPGTGKTTLVTHLLAILRKRQVSFALGAPTGRAAKRMTEATRVEAKTIHRLLEFSPREMKFMRDEKSLLSADFVIVDEASMIDLPLMAHLLRALPARSHLLLLGDVDQLPPVGPGNVLKDLIGSGAVPKSVLRHIFRQGEESLTVSNAHRILQGLPLEFGDRKTETDFLFLHRETEDEILETVKKLVQERIPNRLGLDPGRGIQVLSPTHRGLLGTAHLNHELQYLLNPNGESVEKGERLFRVGDKVMQLRNNYDKGVFNGDIGRIGQVNRQDHQLTVAFDAGPVNYKFDELDEIGLAYATSVHKSQGSEYPAVVVLLHTSHYPMLYRSILYTAITRGKNLVVLVGSKKAVSMAIRNVRIERRFTGLKERIREAMGFHTAPTSE